MNNDSIVVTGVGYIGPDSYGSAFKEIENSSGDTRDIYAFLKEASVIDGSIKNFGRFNDSSKRACMAAGLALYDSGTDSDRNDCGLISADTDGATDANLKYFKDYHKYGRTLGRANLFIYTLPTSPLAEISIHFGLNGPLLYMTGSRNSVHLVLSQARNLLTANRASSMLTLASVGDETLCFIVEKIDHSRQNEGLRVDTVLQRLNESCEFVRDAVASLIRAGKQRDRK